MVQFAMPHEVLFSFVGNRDPLEIPRGQQDPGPVLSLLRARAVSHVALFITTGDYLERAQVIKEIALAEGLARTFSFVDLELQSVVDYEELYAAMTEAVTHVRSSITGQGSTPEYSVLLDPGTPQMQTVWFLLVQTGLLPARLLQGIPARFSGGTYRCREVRLRRERFPIEMRLRGSGHAHSPGHAHGDGTGDEGTSQGGTSDGGTSVSESHWTRVGTTIVGEAPAIRDLLNQVDRAARYDELVLITGETGTGKELIARRLHDMSPRRNAPFYALNAATLDTTMAGSTLFGHSKGAFTGADAQRLGAFRAARGGTLFLDEIGELTLDMQVRLLRAVELKEITPLGEDRTIHVDVRVVVATNRDLSAMVRAGTFRDDLYQRLRQIPLAVPPLRDRPGDIARLARSFVSVWNDRYGTALFLEDTAVSLLEQYDWPGNVRQLRNLVNRLCVMESDNGHIAPARVEAMLDEECRALGVDLGLGVDLNLGVGEESPQRKDEARRQSTVLPKPELDPAVHLLNDTGPVDLRAIQAENERRWYKAALDAAGGNQADAARLLGINPPAFRKALRERFPDL